MERVRDTVSIARDIKESQNHRSTTLSELIVATLGSVWDEVASDNKASFLLFLTACAERIGQLLSIESLGQEAGGKPHVLIREWLELLTEARIIFFLKPTTEITCELQQEHVKIYFYDLGFASQLLGLPTIELLLSSNHWGSLVENCLVLTLLDLYGLKQLSFWRDTEGREIDVVLTVPAPADLSLRAEDEDKYCDQQEQSPAQFHDAPFLTFCIEIKSNDEFQPEACKHLLFLSDCLGLETYRYAVVYLGQESGVHHQYVAVVPATELEAYITAEQNAEEALRSAEPRSSVF